MKTAYGIVWREEGYEQSGRLSIHDDRLLLTSLEDEDVVLRELSLEQLLTVALLSNCGSAPELALRLRDEEGDETTVAIESRIGSWIVRELLDKLLAQSNARGIPLHLLLSRAAEPIVEPAAPPHPVHVGLGF
jgi:hypothetical protein